MKYFILLAGIVISLYSMYNLISHAGDYENLTEYGKGYVIGNVLLLVAGLSLLYAAYRKKVKIQS